jgi:sugar phosphate isomerase/epimerase
MLKIGCQTYTWEMLGDAWRGDPDDLLRAVAAGGYAGIEITDTMIGRYADDAPAFAEALSRQGLTFVAFAAASPSGYTEPAMLASDLAMVENHVRFLSAFPGTILSLGSATVMSPGTREDKFDAAARLYNDAAKIGARHGVDVAVHPSSHHDTLLFTREDYDALMARLDPAVGWVPDTGHILRGGQDILDVLSTYRDRIRYLHLKDVDAGGHWAMLGRGICDTAAVVKSVASAPHFNGWLVLEEESDEARADPAGAVRANRQTLRKLLDA